jgi:serine/threonine-protein kinase RsbW
MTRAELDEAVWRSARSARGSVQNEPDASGTGLLSCQAAVAAGPRFLARQAFPGRPDEIRTARAWLARLVNGFAAADDVVLACSELASNAIIHSHSGQPGGMFTVRASVDSEQVRVEVIDEGGPWGAAVRCDIGLEESGLSGRGLAIIAAIATTWGIAGDQEGRTAWFEVRAR